MQVNLGLMFERKAKISCNGGRSVTNNLRARQDYMRTLGKQTSAGLKITFVDMTYPGQHPELPSLSRHFLLLPINHICIERRLILFKKNLGRTCS